MISFRNISSEEDIKLVYQWRNTPYIVERSTSQKKVAWEEHFNWFKSSLKDENKFIHIIQYFNEPIGLLRFDKESNNSKTCVISIYLVKKNTKKGLGNKAILEGSKLIFSHWPKVEEIFAFVRKENATAIKAFGKAGYTEVEYQDDFPKNHNAFKFMKNEGF